MPAEHRLRVVLYWHMHQPEYRDLVTGEFTQPWTYLHAIKDYSDMAAHLEANRAARAVVNFTPVLLAQLEDYERQIDNALRADTPIRDPLLAALAAPTAPLTSDARAALVKSCLRAHPQTMVKRHPAFARLVDVARLTQQQPFAASYLTSQFMTDLVTWYHLAWFGESERRTSAGLTRLIEQGGDYTLGQRREVLAIVGRVIGGLGGRYRHLARRGQVELTTSPYAHPIMPLLLDFASAAEATPGIALPELPAYPEGAARVRAQLAHGRACFERYFGVTAAGCWPSEGAVSAPTLALIGEAGFAWTATGAEVLRNSLAAAGQTFDVYRPYRAATGGPVLFARDDGLSDMIGFTYSDWHSADAVADLEAKLCHIADQPSDHDRVVSIIMDGENAWEYYPANAFDFLNALYECLATHPRLKLTTYAEVIETVEPVALQNVVAGSWVYGNLTTWIGNASKNRAWEILGEAKQAWDAHAPGADADADWRRAIEQLMVCEGSDWFWWPGDDNPADSVQDFDRLFRMHVGNLYRALGIAPPGYLREPLSHGGGEASRGGVMRQGREAGQTA